MLFEHLVEQAAIRRLVEDSSNHCKRSGALVFVGLLQQPRAGAN